VIAVSRSRRTPEDPNGPQSAQGHPAESFPMAAWAKRGQRASDVPNSSVGRRVPQPLRGSRSSATSPATPSFSTITDLLVDSSTRPRPGPMIS